MNTKMDSESDRDICDWKNKYYVQWKFTNTVIAQYKSLKLNEKKLKVKLKELEEDKACVNSELSCYKTKLDEKNDTIKKLNTDLKSKEDELCNAQKKLKYVCNRLRLEFKCQQTELLNPDSPDEQMEKKVNFEQGALPLKFKIVCEKLCETKTALDEAKDIIQNDVCSIKNRVMAIEKLSVGEENKQYKVLELQARQLKETNCLKDEELRRMNKKFKELERENECNILKINEQKAKLQESKWIIESIQLLETKSELPNQENNYFSLQKKLNNMFQSLPTKYCSPSDLNN